jgi:DNA-binding transcriptional regulator YdaS (Cro superfamily)
MHKSSIMVASEMVGVLKDLCIEIGVELASYSNWNKERCNREGNAGKPVMIAKAIELGINQKTIMPQMLSICIYWLKRLTTMKIKLLSDRILVSLRLKREILLVLYYRKSKKQRRKCCVAIGPKVKELKVGDTVRKFRKYLVSHIRRG